MTTTRITVRISALIAAAALMFVSAEVHANGAKGGASRLLAAPKTATVAVIKKMDCPDCKSTFSRRVEKSSKGSIGEIKVVEVHACKSCSTKFEVKGVGKGKVSVPVHACAKCKK